MSPPMTIDKDGLASLETFSETIVACVERCPNFVDFPTAWAVQHDRGDKLEHHPRCSSVPGWAPISGPAFLCDCGAVEKEANRIRTLLPALKEVR